MHVSAAQPGDIIYANKDIFNDGSLPETPVDQLVAKEGSRGVLVNTGHYEEFPETTLYLVRFENETNELGMPVTCLEDEIVYRDEN